MSLVRGHWRRTPSGKTVWVKEHLRDVKDDPSLFGCGGILVCLYFLFMSPFHILGAMNALFQTNFMGGSNELEVWLPLCAIVFVILIILFIVGWITDIPILLYLPLIITLVSIIILIITFAAGILEVFKIIGNFINQFR